MPLWVQLLFKNTSGQQSMKQQSWTGSSLPHLNHSLTGEIKDAFGRLCAREHQGTDVLSLKNWQSSCNKRLPFLYLHISFARLKTASDSFLGLTFVWTPGTQLCWGNLDDKYGFPPALHYSEAGREPSGGLVFQPSEENVYFMNTTKLLQKRLSRLASPPLCFAKQPVLSFQVRRHGKLLCHLKNTKNQSPKFYLFNKLLII